MNVAVVRDLRSVQRPGAPRLPPRNRPNDVRRQESHRARLVVRAI